MFLLLFLVVTNSTLLINTMFSFFFFLNMLCVRFWELIRRFGENTALPQDAARNALASDPRERKEEKEKRKKMKKE